MKEIDFSKLEGIDLYDIGYVLCRTLIYKNDSLYIQHDDSELFKVVLPKYEDIYLRDYNLALLPIEYKQYKGGYYLSTVDNEYCFFIKPITSS